MAYHNLNEKNIPLTSYPDVPIASPLQSPVYYAQPVVGQAVGQPPMYAQPAQPEVAYSPQMYQPVYPQGQPQAAVYAQAAPAQQYPSYQPVYVPSPIAQPTPSTPTNYADLKTAIRARSAHLSCGRYVKQAHQFAQKNWCKLFAAFLLWSLIGWGVSAGIDALSGRHLNRSWDDYNWEGHPDSLNACEQQRQLDETECAGKMGCFKTTCDENGGYASIQSFESLCWCVDEWGKKFEDTMQTCSLFGTDCDVLRSQPRISACQTRRKLETEACGGIGCFISQCEEDGSFSSKQTHSSAGSCWCVDEMGAEINGTRSTCDGYTQCWAPAPTWVDMMPSHVSVDKETVKQFVLWGFLHVLVTIFLWSPVLSGFYFAVFNAIKHNTSIRFPDFFSGFSCRYYCKLLSLSFVMRFAETLLFLLILPGIWWALATMFAIPLHKEHPFLGVCGSIRLSMMVIHSHFCAMIGFLLLLALLQIAGFLCFIVGVLYTAPLAFVALCYCYHDLIGIVTEVPFAGPVDIPLAVHV